MTHCHCDVIGCQNEGVWQGSTPSTSGEILCHSHWGHLHAYMPEHAARYVPLMSRMEWLALADRLEDNASHLIIGNTNA